MKTYCLIIYMILNKHSKHLLKSFLQLQSVQQLHLVSKNLRKKITGPEKRNYLKEQMCKLAEIVGLEKIRPFSTTVQMTPKMIARAMALLCSFTAFIP
jgi:hypothetical protein